MVNSLRAFIFACRSLFRIEQSIRDLEDEIEFAESLPEFHSLHDQRDDSLAEVRFLAIDEEVKSVCEDIPSACEFLSLVEKDEEEFCVLSVWSEVELLLMAALQQTRTES